MTPPRFCSTCHTNRVAWTAPRIDCCYACLPGGPFPAPPCRACGSDRYFSQGLCVLCHPGSPKHPGGCRDCLAWGVLREHNWRCWGCRGWRSRHPVGQCPHCRRAMPLGDHGACRLCWQQALLRSAAGEPFDLTAANRLGQQLFLANMHYQPRRADLAPPRRVPAARDRGPGRHEFAPVRGRQLTLFQLRPNLISLRAVPPAPDPAMARYCDEQLREHAARHGWSTRMTNLVAVSLRAVQAWQDTPGAAITASDATRLLAQRGRTTIESTLEVLAVAGLLEDDRVPAVRGFFLAQTAELPPVMTAQLQTWYTVMTEGSSTRAPRRRPRHPTTIHLHIRGLAPCVRAWAAAGCGSLAEIARSHVVDALPPTGVARLEAGRGLRSLFRILKARKEVFTDPTVGVPIGASATRIPLPLDTALIRDALHSPDPAHALAVALVAFHALTAREVNAIRLVDVRDGRLSLAGRIIPLAGPVRVRLRAYLDHRARRWRGTINPYLVVNRRSAPRTTPVAPRYPWHRLGVAPQALREDRILHEIHATGGDVRRICDLFGLSISAALRYTAALEHPDLVTGPATAATGSRTHDTT